MTIRAEDDWTTTNIPSSISFETAATSGRVERLKITGAGNIGIGITAPVQKLEVNGGVRINTVAPRPVCDASARGTFWVVKGGTGTPDSVSICLKGDGVSADTYAWKNL